MNNKFVFLVSNIYSCGIYIEEEVGFDCPPKDLFIQGGQTFLELQIWKSLK